ncbi:enoyl-ACP reductase FabI [Tumebacillus permanentifrigoris]|uniref:Enoyl-[acyl-carrier-protein] reductase [NADH] n=1 Tax=Tumebacillus permanentifrigoris TaxID=378543 RepID=A0A316DAY2_9BACL|nr:enoyl-ACP reductase FabI [Tumebacillus permanentifrigoris]PWK13766.1 enoyl-[acyl-carrier-protein] reductase [NADH] [Tumebacillus permanentifrigoris]
MNQLLAGKKFLIMGVANDRSIAWAIAKQLHEAGATLAFSYQGDRLESRVLKLVESTMPGSTMVQVDVTREEEIASAFALLKEQWGTMDGLVHSLAFAKSEELEGHFSDTSREGYLLAQDISAYSLVAVSRFAKTLMVEGGSIITMTYLGGERVLANYNVMGVAKAALDQSVRYLAADLGEQNIRVNAISAGPINTLAARGVRNFSTILGVVAEKAPLKRNITQEEVAKTALFLASDLSSGITGEVIHVDAGYHIMA